MRRLMIGLVGVLAVAAAVDTAQAGMVTGSPLADGWTFSGNALSNGIYVRGSANYGYDTYGAVLTVQPGSNLQISDGANSWLAGDTVLGVGGLFADITAGEAGWDAFTGNAVNVLLGGADLGADVKLQAKFSTILGNFTPSTVAPGAGNGLGSFGSHAGLGAVQVRTSAYFGAAEWSAGSGILQLLDKPSHIERNGASAPDSDVARLMWIWDGTSSRVDTWEIFLNTSLLTRLYPDFEGPAPAAGDSILMTVQNRDGVYTDGLVTVEAVIPEPSTLLLSLLGGLGVAVGLWRRKRAS